MNRTTLIVALVALVIGFGAGFTSRPMLTSETEVVAASGLPQPTEAEATAAVRRYKVGFSTYPNATLTLGDFSPGTIGAGVACMTKITLDPARQTPVQMRSMGFARVDGQWEVSQW